MHAQDRPTPWYRQFWPWMLIALPASAVIASFVSLYFAVHDPDGLVVDDYYKQGLAINQVLARDRAAAKMGLRAGGRLDVAEHRVYLDLQSLQPVGTAPLTIRLLHATRAHHDQTVQLHYDPSHQRYVGALRDLVPGYWDISLEPGGELWRLTGRLRIPGDGRFDLVATLAAKTG